MNIELIESQVGASKSPTASSFIRPKRPTDPPVTFVEAVKGKYAPGDDPQSPSLSSNGTKYSSIRISGKQVEEVGFEKVRKQLSNLQQLRVVIVDTLCIQRPHARQRNGEHASDVSETCPRVLELDISRNLYETWDEMIDICRQLPELTTLRADGNRFHLIPDSPYQHYLRLAPFTALKSLSLDNTLLSWEEVSIAI